MLVLLQVFEHVQHWYRPGAAVCIVQALYLQAQLWP